MNERFLNMPSLKNSFGILETINFLMSREQKY